MRRYRSNREILAEVDRVLAATPAQWRNSPLDEVTGILSRGRHYSWVGIYLRTGQADTAEDLLGTGGLLAPIRIGARVLGAIEVTGAHNPRADALLLKEVARRLARFLSGNGKWLLRKVREAAPPAVEDQPEEEAEMSVGAGRAR